MIRRVLPKGTSIDDLTQEDIFLMINHINLYKRKKLNNRSLHDAFSFYYGEELLQKLRCLPIRAENIILKPKLLEKQQYICINRQRKTTDTINKG